MFTPRLYKNKTVNLAEMCLFYSSEKQNPALGTVCIKSERSTELFGKGGAGKNPRGEQRL